MDMEEIHYDGPRVDPCRGSLKDWRGCMVGQFVGGDVRYCPHERSITFAH